jgi:hypothetical protein
MNNDSLEPLEEQLAHSRQSKAPADLRAPVLGAVHRELAAQRWERRLGRSAAAILLLGIGLNWSLGWHDPAALSRQKDVASAPDPQAIVEVAVAVGNATDAETGSRLAQQLAALSGVPLSPQQAAAMEQEIQRRVKGSSLSPKEGSS